MLLKTESFNQVRQDRENLRKDYKQMAQIAHDRSVQVASLGALANEVTALYGLRQNKLAANQAANAAAAPTPKTLALNEDVNSQQVKLSLDQFYNLRTQALSGRLTRALENGLSPSFEGDWNALADAPSLWPLEGRVTSSFGERQDPINGEGAFHSGMDISAGVGAPVRAAADGDVVSAEMASGYGREVVLNHGHDVETVYGHLSAFAVIQGQHVSRGQVIGYVGQSGRATGPHLHYEVRVHSVPVNPYKYLRVTFAEVASLDAPGSARAGQ
jgi:murein DD-endopeptidase MepM/ murein hydrolase activator NlpD